MIGPGGGRCSPSICHKSNKNEKNRNPRRTGKYIPPGIRRESECEENFGRRRRSRQDREAHPGRTGKLCRHHRPHFTGCAVLQGIPEERGSIGNGGDQQSLLVERRREGI